ncbi:hypothetical protein [Lysinibacillus parviboronicapiens]|uniref:hypothetical protein n=1 Tax=Lysinibacillus parviboronicapiens TaxID=436516 RepID=UPI000D3A4BC9|nr:hypothetical protein [Lysinibacillus parviboronicapiens]
MRYYYFWRMIYTGIFIGLLVILGGCIDRIIEIEESNTYHWQKNMNQTEFEQLKEGMTYLEVIEIAGGHGEKVRDNHYRWDDEILLTQAYIVQFKDEKLLSKEIIIVKGHSTRK